MTNSVNPSNFPLVSSGDVEAEASLAPRTAVDFDVIRVHEGTLRAYNFSNDKSTVIADNKATVHAFGNVTVYATGNARVFAHDRANVVAAGSAVVNAFGYGEVITSEEAQARVYDTRSATATGMSSIEAHDMSRVTALDMTHTSIHDDVNAVIRGAANADVHDDSTVHVFSSATANIYGGQVVLHNSAKAQLYVDEQNIVREGDVLYFVGDPENAADTVFGSLTLTGASSVLDREHSQGLPVPVSEQTPLPAVDESAEELPSEPVQRPEPIETQQPEVAPEFPQVEAPQLNPAEFDSSAGQFVTDIQPVETEQPTSTDTQVEQVDTNSFEETYTEPDTPAESVDQSADVDQVENPSEGAISLDDLTAGFENSSVEAVSSHEPTEESTENYSSLSREGSPTLPVAEGEKLTNEHLNYGLGASVDPASPKDRVPLDQAEQQLVDLGWNVVTEATGPYQPYGYLNFKDALKKNANAADEIRKKQNERKAAAEKSRPKGFSFGGGSTSDTNSSESAVSGAGKAKGGFTFPTLG